MSWLEVSEGLCGWRFATDLWQVDASWPSYRTDHRGLSADLYRSVSTTGRVPRIVRIKRKATGRSGVWRGFGGQNVRKPVHKPVHNLWHL